MPLGRSWSGKSRSSRRKHEPYYRSTRDFTKTHKFNGKIYKLHDAYRAYSHAKDTAEMLRRNGQSARILGKERTTARHGTRTWYGVYKRKRKKRKAK